MAANTEYADVEIIPNEADDMKPAGTAIATRRPAAAPARRELVAGMLMPVATPDEILHTQQAVRDLIQKALQEGRDYGNIPGTARPTLLKPGAERINAAYAVAAEYGIMEKEIDHNREVPWTKTKWRTRTVKPEQDEANALKESGQGRWRKNDDGSWYFQDREDEEGFSLGLYRYVVECRLIHRESGVMVGQGMGVCSSLESKYIDRPRETENTILKMASKRALIAATLNAYGLSDQFTQDVEDFAGEGGETGNGSSPASTNGTSSARSSGSSGNGSGGSGGKATPGTSSAKTDIPKCPKCEGPMWDNREKKAKGEYKDTAPDFGCKKKDCDGKVWPEKEEPTAGEQATQMDRYLESINVLIKEIAKHSAEQATAAEKMRDELVAKEGVTAEDLRKFGGQLNARLQNLIAESKKKPAAAPPPPPPPAPPAEDQPEEDDDLPF